MTQITWKQMQRHETRQRRIFWLRLALILALSVAILLALSLLCPPLAGGVALAPTWTPTATATPNMWLPSPLPGPTQTWTATPGYRIPETPTCTPTLAATVGGPPCYVCKRCHGREECGTGWCNERGFCQCGTHSYCIYLPVLLHAPDAWASETGEVER